MSSDIVIERKTPVPPRKTQIYPFGELKPTDSFVVPYPRDKTNQLTKEMLIARVRSALHYWLRTHPQLKGKFRVVDDPAGVRVGRIG